MELIKNSKDKRAKKLCKSKVKKKDSNSVYKVGEKELKLEKILVFILARFLCPCQEED
jgi:hypothetical protein